MSRIVSYLDLKAIMSEMRLGGWQCARIVERELCGSPVRQDRVKGLILRGYRRELDNSDNLSYSDICYLLEKPRSQEMFLIYTFLGRQLNRRSAVSLYFKAVEEAYFPLANPPTTERKGALEAAGKSKPKLNIIFLIGGLSPHVNNSHKVVFQSVLEGLLSIGRVDDVLLASTNEFLLGLEQVLSADFRNARDFFSREAAKIKKNIGYPGAAAFNYWGCDFSVKDTDLGLGFREKVSKFDPDVIIMPAGVFAPSFIKPFIWDFENLVVPMNASHRPDRWAKNFLDVKDCSEEARLKNAQNLQYIPGRWPVCMDTIKKRWQGTDKGASHEVKTSRKPRLITVLGNGRLLDIFTKYSLDERRLIRTTLDNYADSWLLVGIGKSELKEMRRMFGFRRLAVYSYDYLDPLEKGFGQADLFFEVPGSGGGGYGALRAIGSGLPVLAFEGSDISNYVPETQCYANVDELSDKLKLIAQDSGVLPNWTACGLNFVRINFAPKATVTEWLANLGLLPDKSRV